MLFPFVGKNLKIGRVINLSEIPDLVNSCGFNLSIHSLTHSFSQCLLSNYFVPNTERGGGAMLGLLDSMFPPS